MAYTWQFVGDAGAIWVRSLEDSSATSMTALHSCGPFTKSQTNSLLICTAAFEAVVGLFIKATFVATFVQRFIGK